MDLYTATDIFFNDRTEENLLRLLEVLSQSLVWIPCNIDFGKADGDDSSEMVPDLLKSGEKTYFPIFSSMEEMGEYGRHFSKIQQPMAEVIRLAENHERKLQGIVLNAFSKPFILSGELISIVKKLSADLSE